MIKKMRYIVIVSFLVCFSPKTWSIDVEVGGINYSINGEYASVIPKSDGTKYYGNIIIPETIPYNSNTYIVKSLGSLAFKNCEELVSLQLPNTIESMGSFLNCSKLETLYIPSGITSFFENQFSGCNNLKYVHISDLSAWCKIKFHQIKGTGNIYSDYVKFVSNPLSNGAELILNGEKISSLVFPSDIENIPGYAFYGCSSINKITIPEHITQIGIGAFANCTNIKEVDHFSECRYDICVGEKRIPTHPFANSKIEIVSLSSKRIIEDDAEKTSYNVGGYVSGYTSYYFDYNLYISELFPYVREFIVLNGATQIGAGKFSGCSHLEKIHIPSSIKIIGNAAFGGCNELRCIEINDLSCWCEVQLGSQSANPFRNGAELYLNGEKVINCQIPTTTDKINNYVFSGCTSIESLVIPEAVKRIENRAFEGCCNLEHVHLSSSITNIGYHVFYNCEKLKTVGPFKSNSNIEYSWNSKIPAEALSNISNLQTIIIPSTIVEIGDNAFAKDSQEQLPILNIYTNALIPPTIKSGTFSNYSATLFVPKDSKESYSNASYWKNFNIIELVDIESIEIDKKQYDITVGNPVEIEVTILPEKATYKDLYWSVEDNSIASVINGVVTGLKTGTTKVTATTTDGTHLSASCIICVTNPVSAISLNKSEIQLESGENETLTAICTPLDADDITITWRSLDNNVAIVNNGDVKAIAVGETEIVATSVNNIEAHCKVIVKPTLATSITLNKHAIGLTTGNSETLKVSIMPTKTTYKTVLWKSNNEQVATVDNTGSVYAKGNGTATISVSTTDGSNLSDECIVTVTTLATGIALNKTSESLIVGQTLSLDATIVPITTSNKDVKWESNNSGCASVTSDGEVKAIATGTATISATTTDGTNISTSCVITVTNPVISLTLDKTRAELMVGQHVTLSASCIPINADNTTITWRTSDNAVASVVNGFVTANKLGDAVITASSANGIEASCSISVIPTPVSSLQLNETSISIVKDQVYTLVCTVNPNDATNKEVIWNSQNENIAKVDEDGKVTGVATGETTIIVHAKSDSNKTTSCKVKVTTPITAIQLDYAKLDLYVEDNLQLYAMCTPSSADNKNVEWSSSNTNIAVVSNTGYVTIKNAGEVRITATTTDGTNLSAICDITVKKIPQTIAWNDELALLQKGGEMIALNATSSSGMIVKFISSDDNVVSIFDTGDVIYANPVNSGTAIITSYQEGNYKYEAIESKKGIEVVESPGAETKTLIAYYSPYVLIDGIVAELANQLAGSNASIFTQKIEPTNDRINSANSNSEIRDSVMNIILQYPNEVSSYPEIKNVNANINNYDNVIIVYPLWNALMAAPMQTFCFKNKDTFKNKSVAYIEYDLLGDTESSNANILRLNPTNIDNKSELIKEWLGNSDITSILRLHNDNRRIHKGIYDLHGRKLIRDSEHGIFIVNGKKGIK